MHEYYMKYLKESIQRAETYLVFLPFIVYSAGLPVAASEYDMVSEILNANPTEERPMDPKGEASRAECAQMIKNLFDNVINK